jgi:hypothetical protein
MPNEQITVPLFTAGEVLTAANMNISAGTGVPVFANTTTRDAGFGGAGEKVLAEGQLCYLSSTNVVQYYDGAAWATVGPSNSTPRIGQVISTTKTDSYTMSSDTYATITGLTATITPSSATSKIYIVGTLSAVGKTLTNRGISRLIRDSTPIAIGDAAGSRTTGTTGAPIQDATTDIYSLGLTFLDSPSSTSALVYGIQIRTCEPSGTVYVNRSEGDANNTSHSRVVSTITVMEILV